jgi:hypothetical protein
MTLDGVASSGWEDHRLDDLLVVMVTGANAYALVSHYGVMCIPQVEVGGKKGESALWIISLTCIHFCGQRPWSFYLLSPHR